MSVFGTVKANVKAIVQGETSGLVPSIGMVRTATAQVFAAFRNAGNTADGTALSTDSSDRVVVGDSSAVGGIDLSVKSASILRWIVNGTTKLTVGATGLLDAVGGLSSDTIAEHTAASGVTVDGLTIKDGMISRYESFNVSAQKSAPDALAVTATGRYWFYTAKDGVTVVGAGWKGSDNVSSNATNYLTLNLLKCDSSGSVTTLATVNTSATGFTANITTNLSGAFGTLADDESLGFEILKAAAGAVCPAGCLNVRLTRT